MAACRSRYSSQDWPQIPAITFSCSFARSGRQGQGFVASDELLAPDTREQDETRLHYMKVMQRVNALPEAQRNAVFLVYVEGFTYQEAAETLGVPIGTVMSRLATARARLARSADALPPVKEKRS